MITAADILAAQATKNVEYLTAAALQLLGALEEARSKPVTRKVTQRAVMETWLTPFMEAWEAELGAGTFPFGPASKPLKKLLDKGHTPDEVVRNLGFYLRDARRRDGMKFASITKFCQTFKDWDPSAPAWDGEDD